MNENKNIEIWVLADDKAGHKNQALGVAEALGMSFSIKNIVYNKKSSRPNIFKHSNLIGFDEEKSDSISEPYPNIVIAAGRKTAPIAKYIKNQSKKAGGRTFLVQLMWPGFPANGFDMIAVPEHDNRSGKNIIQTIGSPHRITEEFLSTEGDMWRKTLLHNNPSSPHVSLLIGGNTGKTSFSEKHARELCRFASKLVKNLGGSLFVTNSRRTPDIVTNTFKEILVDQSSFQVNFHDCEEKRANPYYAFLALSDVVIVTGDSISMCSEACATGKLVYIFSPDDIIPKKHKKMHESLYKRGFAIKLDEEELQNIKEAVINHNNAVKNPLNTAKYVADKIIEKFYPRFTR